VATLVGAYVKSPGHEGQGLRSGLASGLLDRTPGPRGLFRIESTPGRRAPSVAKAPRLRGVAEGHTVRQRNGVAFRVVAGEGGRGGLGGLGCVHTLYLCTPRARL
jgi:hypothetical protein